MNFLRILLFVGAGAGLGYIIGKQLGKSDEEKNDNGSLGALVGGGAGLIAALAFDTVNYVLKDRNGNVVYHGITGDHRISQRESEHLLNGKKFHSMECGPSLPRELARGVERNRISRDRPKYNVQHNRF